MSRERKNAGSIYRTLCESCQIILVKMNDCKKFRVRLKILHLFSVAGVLFANEVQISLTKSEKLLIKNRTNRK